MCHIRILSFIQIKALDTDPNFEFSKFCLISYFLNVMNSPTNLCKTNSDIIIQICTNGSTDITERV